MSVWGQVLRGDVRPHDGQDRAAGLGAHRGGAVRRRRPATCWRSAAGPGQPALLRRGVRTLTITEPEKPMVRRLEGASSTGPDATLLRAPAEDLPFNDESFDVVVSTLVLCTVDDQPRALREVRRVLRPGGRLLFMEHVRSDDAKLAAGRTA